MRPKSPHLTGLSVKEIAVEVLQLSQSDEATHEREREARAPPLSVASSFDMVSVNALL